VAGVEGPIDELGHLLAGKIEDGQPGFARVWQIEGDDRLGVERVRRIRMQLQFRGQHGGRTLVDGGLGTADDEGHIIDQEGTIESSVKV